MMSRLAWRLTAFSLNSYYFCFLLQGDPTSIDFIKRYFFLTNVTNCFIQLYLALALLHDLSLFFSLNTDQGTDRLKKLLLLVTPVSLVVMLAYW